MLVSSWAATSPVQSEVGKEGAQAGMCGCGEHTALEGVQRELGVSPGPTPPLAPGPDFDLTSEEIHFQDSNISFCAQFFSVSLSK